MTPQPTGLWILARPLPYTVVKSAMTGDNGKGAFATFYVATDLVSGHQFFQHWLMEKF